MAEFTTPPPFTVGVNGFVTIVATQSLQLRAVSANTLSYFLFLVVVFLATIVVVVFLFYFSSKNGRFVVSRKYDVIIRNLKKLKYQNILAFTVCLIVQITSLIHQNCQFSRKAAINLNLHFCPFWSKVTHSPDSSVNVPIESRSLRKNGTVPSNRIYEMNEITFIHAISTHCRI